MHQLTVLHFALTSLLLVIVSVAEEAFALDNTVIQSYTNCHETEYTAYLNCIESEKESRRHKRQKNDGDDHQIVSAETAHSISENCNRLNVECRSNCVDNTTCVSECPVCPIFIHSDAADSVTGDEPARPVDDYQTVIIEGTNSTGETQKFDYKIEAGRNVTTVIKLTNLINNTNTIHMPTNVSTSNINHIHIHRKNASSATSDTGGEFGLGSNGRGACCLVSRPKNCVQTPNGQRCHYQKMKTCGPQCTSKVIHARSKKVCHQGRRGGCIRYGGAGSFAPQPSQQKCMYVDVWPYVSCGGSHAPESCDGCYDVYDGEDDDLANEDRTDCRGCYDDGFEYGPLYRRGPVLRPFYYHTVPCYIVGACYAVPVYADWNMYPQMGFEPMADEDDLDDFEVETETTKPENNGSHNETENWTEVDEKCKIVSDDGSIEIRNCSSTSLDNNPYATYPIDEPVEGSPDGFIRPNRHIQNHNRMSRHHLRKTAIVEDENVSDIDENDNDVDEPRMVGRRRRSRQHYSKRRRPDLYYEDEYEEMEEY